MYAFTLRMRKYDAETILEECLDPLCEDKLENIQWVGRKTNTWNDCSCMYYARTWFKHKIINDLMFYNTVVL